MSCARFCSAQAGQLSVATVPWGVLGRRLRAVAGNGERRAAVPFPRDLPGGFAKELGKRRGGVLGRASAEDLGLSAR